MALGQQSLPSMAFVQQLADLVRVLAELDDDGAAADERLARWLWDALAVSGFAVLDTSEDRPRVMAANPPGLAELEQPPGSEGVGPAFIVGRTNSRLTCADIDTWADTLPRYVESARALDVRAVAVLPLVARDRSFGALCLYSRSVRTWSEPELGVGALLAELLASRLGHVAELRKLRVLTGQLQGALDSRILLEQAKGVLAASEGIDVEVAFERIRSHARRTNTKVAAVASAVITTGLRPPPA